jgi:hypothetical protein
MSLMADKLGMDIGQIESEEFEKSMAKLASQYDDLHVDGYRITITDGLKKSFSDPILDKNFLYEIMAKKAYRW